MVTGHGNGGGQGLISFIDLYKNDSRHRELTGSRQGMHATGTLQHNDLQFLQPLTINSLYHYHRDTPATFHLLLTVKFNLFRDVTSRVMESVVGLLLLEGHGLSRTRIPSLDKYEAICQRHKCDNNKSEGEGACQKIDVIRNRWGPELLLNMAADWERDLGICIASFSSSTLRVTFDSIVTIATPAETSFLCES